LLLLVFLALVVTIQHSQVYLAIWSIIKLGFQEDFFVQFFARVVGAFLILTPFDRSRDSPLPFSPTTTGKTTGDKRQKSKGERRNLEKTTNDERS
jgi:hypothetical protein